MDNERPNDKQLTSKQKLLYPDLSYKVVGLIYRINDEIGFGQKEKVYAAALEKLLQQENMPYQRELYFPVKMGTEVLARKYFDFFIDNKIVLEIKVGDHLYKEACGQLFQYLKLSNTKLGIIARFTRNGVKIKRIPCFY